MDRKMQARSQILWQECLFGVGKEGWKVCSKEGEFDNRGKGALYTIRATPESLHFSSITTLLWGLIDGEAELS